MLSESLLLPSVSSTSSITLTLFCPLYVNEYVLLELVLYVLLNSRLLLESLVRGYVDLLSDA